MNYDDVIPRKGNPPPNNKQIQYIFKWCWSCVWLYLCVCVCVCVFMSLSLHIRRRWYYWIFLIINNQNKQYIKENKHKNLTLLWSEGRRYVYSRNRTFLMWECKTTERRFKKANRLHDFTLIFDWKHKISLPFNSNQKEFCRLRNQLGPSADLHS